MFFCVLVEDGPDVVEVYDVPFVLIESFHVSYFSVFFTKFPILIFATIFKPIVNPEVDHLGAFKNDSVSFALIIVSVDGDIEDLREDCFEIFTSVSFLSRSAFHLCIFPINPWELVWVSDS